MAIGVKFFRSSDSGSPVMSGTAGAYIALLDAILINGYNSKTITITRSGTTATATCTTHGFITGQVIVVSGADQADYNGDFYITSAPTANTFTYTVANSPATPATGTITAKIAPAGWAKAYSDTNLAAYRAASGNRFYYRVNDTGTTTARVIGYESMSDINTGVDGFPLEAQFSGGLYIAKSTVVDATARSWVAIATNKVFYILLNWSNGSYNSEITDPICFGEFNSRVTSDSYKTIIIARNTSSTGTGSNTWILVASTAGSFTQTGHYITRNYNGATKSVAFGKRLAPIANPTGTSGTFQPTIKYPAWPDQKLHLSNYGILETATTGVLRGTLGGIWYSAQNMNTSEFRTFDIIDASAGSTLTGKKFIFVRTSSSDVFLEISDTWSIT